MSATSQRYRPRRPTGLVSPSRLVTGGPRREGVHREGPYATHLPVFPHKSHLECRHRRHVGVHAPPGPWFSGRDEGRTDGMLTHCQRLPAPPDRSPEPALKPVDLGRNSLRRLSPSPPEVRDSGVGRVRCRDGSWGWTCLRSGTTCRTSSLGRVRPSSCDTTRSRCTSSSTPGQNVVTRTGRGLGNTGRGWCTTCSSTQTSSPGASSHRSNHSLTPESGVKGVGVPKSQDSRTP